MRNILQLSIVFLISFQVLAIDLSGQEKSKPNVLLICIDDLKPAIGAYGDKLAVTPNIDRLAKRGVLFEAAYCNQAVCSPSRNALMTSLRPQTLGIYDLATNFRKSAPDAITLSQHFMNNGYKAEALGKIFHVGQGNSDDAASWSVPLYRSKAKAYAKNSEKKPAKDGGQAKGTVTENADIEDQLYPDGDVALEACRRIDAASKSHQPFFIAVGFIRPHLPFNAPKKYWDMHEASKFSLPEFTEAPKLAPTYAKTGFGELRTYAGIPDEGPITDELTRHLIHGYYAAASYTDAQIGLVLDALDNSAAKDNTIVVLWGDHGWHLGDHGQWCKHTNYEQAARIPVIVSAPGKASNAQTTSLIESVDVYPTLSELAGLAQPKDIDGKSFVGVLEDPTAKTKDHIIHVYPRASRLGRAIRTDRYRMVEWKEIGAAKDTAEYELYDYELDPLETRNIASEAPEVLAELQAILAQHPEAKPAIKKTAAADNSNSKPKEPVDRVKLFERKDTDKDSSLTFDEFMTNQPDPDQAKQRFSKFDKNQDMRLSREEFFNQGK